MNSHFSVRSDGRAIFACRLHYKKGRIETRIDASNDETLMPRSDVVGYGPSSAKATGTAWERLQKSGMTQYYDGSGW